MTQIQNNTSLPGALGGLGANNPAYTGRKDGSSTDFSRFLNQSSQQLQSPNSAMSALQAQQQSQQLASQQLASQQLQTQQQAQQLQTQQQAQRQTAAQQQQRANNRQPENTAAQDENKLAAKNAAARHEAREANGSTAPARPADAKADATASTEDASDVDAKDTTAAGDAAETDADTRVAKEADGKDKKVAKESKDGEATPAEQMLAMLRGEAPAEAADKPRKGALDGDAAGTDALPGGAQGHGKPATTGEVMRERQQLQRELDQAASGKAGPVEGADKAASQDTLQAVAGGAHEIAQADSAQGPQPSFDALLAAAQQSGAANAPSGADASTAPTAPSVPLSQPLHSPDFAPELSASVSLLIQDGVHEAQLQLNPTEMGPVSINIQLDGQQAQVNFHAQHAATREVLERSLPDLAAALQAQGLTLSGGGVFAQSQSNGGQNREDGASDGAGRASGRRGGRGGSDDDGAIAAAGRSERRSAPRGLVDLYA